MHAKLGLFLLAVTGVAGAVPGHVYPAQGASLGPVVAAGIPGVHANPASGYLHLRPGAKYRSSLLSIVNLGIEAGPVDSFIDRIEDLEGCLEDVVEETCQDANGNVIRGVGDSSIDLDEAELLKDEFDDLLAQIGRDAYFIFGAQFQLPSTPMLFRAFDGVMGIDISGSGAANVSVLDDPLRYNPITEDIETRTAAYVKTARFLSVALSWSRPVEIPLEQWVPGLYTRGDFYLGGRVSVLNAALAKVVAAVDSEDENGDTAFDRAEDAYEDAEESTTNIALDLGLTWVYKGMSAGLTLRNINAPTFKYGAVGTNCAQVSGRGALQDCLIAASFADRIDLREEFEMNPQATIEAAVPLGTPEVMLAASWDMNAANSPVGDQYQWLSLGLSYTPDSRLIPGVRLGYRTNQADRGVSSIGLGLTLFGYFNLDVSQSTDTVEVDGDDIPRAASVSLGFEMPL